MRRYSPARNATGAPGMGSWFAGQRLAPGNARQVAPRHGDRARDRARRGGNPFRPAAFSLGRFK